MKDIKSYIIGFLSCACLFLIMGFSPSDTNSSPIKVEITNLPSNFDVNIKEWPWADKLQVEVSDEY